MNKDREFKKLAQYIYAKNINGLRKSLNKDNIDCRGGNGETLLHIAVAADESDPEIVRMLLSHGATVDLTCGPELLTPLHTACYLLKRDIIRVLLSAGANPNAEDIGGGTPLTRVVQAPNPKIYIVSDLIHHGADPNHRPANGGESPTETASKFGQLGIF